MPPDPVNDPRAGPCVSRSRPLPRPGLSAPGAVVSPQGPNAHFLEDDVSIPGDIAVILQADVARWRPRPPLRLVVLGPLGYDGRVGVEVVHLAAVEGDDDFRAPEGDIQRVPFPGGLGWPRCRPGERVDGPRTVILVVAIADLDLVAVMHGIPRVLRPVRDPHEDARIGPPAARLVDHAEDAIAELLLGVPQETHTALGADESVFEHHLARPDVLPAVEALAVEQRTPSLRFLRRPESGGRDADQRRKRGHYCKQAPDHDSRPPVPTLQR